MNEQHLNKHIFSMLPKDQVERVFSQHYCDIDSSWLGFMDTYHKLSELIPKDFTVVDIGCSYNAQSFLFKGHARLISVDPDIHEYKTERFKPDNCEIYNVCCGEFVKNILPTLGLDMNKTFAIANYVPDWFGDDVRELVRMNFKNIYTFYPNIR